MEQDRAETRLMAGIESLVMRNALTQSRQATLYFYANTPKIAHRIYQNGLSKPIVDNLLRELSDSDATRRYQRSWRGYEEVGGSNSMKKNELISAFYALEGLIWGPYGSGQYSRDTSSHRFLDAPTDFSDYVDQGIGVTRKSMANKKTSFTIGNMFLLTGPANSFREENEEN